MGMNTIEQAQTKILQKNINFANSNYHLMDQNLQEMGGGTGAAINVKDQRADYRVDESAFTDDMAASSATSPQDEEKYNHDRASAGRLVITSSIGSDVAPGRKPQQPNGKGDIQIVTGEYSLSKVDDEDAQQQLFAGGDRNKRAAATTLQAKKSRTNVRGVSGHRSNQRNKPPTKGVVLEAA